MERESISSRFKDRQTGLSSAVNHAQKGIEILDMDSTVLDQCNVQDPSFAVQLGAIRTRRKVFIKGMELSFPPNAEGSAYHRKMTLPKNECLVVNDEFMVHSMAYLYKLGRGLDVLSSQWHDIDFDIAP